MFRDTDRFGEGRVDSSLISVNGREEYSGKTVQLGNHQCCWYRSTKVFASVIASSAAEGWPAKCKDSAFRASK
jgi:hypothetical protein